MTFAIASYSDFGRERDREAWLQRRTKVELFEEIRRDYEHGTGTIKGVAKAQYSAIVLGATGNVGGRIVQLLIKNPLCKKVVVVTRHKTDAFADPKAARWSLTWTGSRRRLRRTPRESDAALAAFGVGKGSAKMPEEELRKIEIAYPQAFCRAAKAGGASVCGVMTAAGADPEAGMKYAKIIGEKEKAVESVKFDFLGVYRPAVILGKPNTPGVLGYAMPLLHWAMPSKYHSIHKNDLARAMVAQSEQAYLAIAQGNWSHNPASDPRPPQRRTCIPAASRIPVNSSGKNAFSAPR
jgi:hypothetical protein